MWTAALLLVLGAASTSVTATVMCSHSPPCTSRDLVAPPPVPKIPCVRFYLPNCGRYAATYGHETTYNSLQPQYNYMTYRYIPILPDMPLSYPQVEADMRPTVEHIKDHADGYLGEHVEGHVEHTESHNKDCGTTGQVAYSNPPVLPAAQVIFPFEEINSEGETSITDSKDDQYTLLVKNPPPPPPTLPPVQDIELTAMPPTPTETIRPETIAEEVFTPPIAGPPPPNPTLLEVYPPAEFILEEQHLEDHYEHEDYNKGTILLETIPPAPTLPEIDMSKIVLPVSVPQITEKEIEVLRPVEYPTNRPLFNIVEEAASFPDLEEDNEQTIIPGNIPPGPTLSPSELPAKPEIQQHHIEGQNQVYMADQYIIKQPLTVPCRLLKVNCFVQPIQAEPIQQDELNPALPTMIEIPVAHANIYQTGIVEPEVKSKDSDCEPKTARLGPSLQTFQNSITVNVPETLRDATLKYVKLDVDSRLYDYPRPMRIVVKKRKAELPAKIETTSVEKTEK